MASRIREGKHLVIMKAEAFIARRLRFKGKMAVIAIAISFFVIIIAMCISSGFSREMRRAVSSLTGDVVLTATYSGISTDSQPISAAPSYLGDISALKEVESIEPVVYSSAVARRSQRGIEGVVFKGTRADTVSLSARIPSGFASSMGLGKGDTFTCWFVSPEGRMRLRKFTVGEIYESAADTGMGHVLYVPAADLRRVLGWNEGQASALEIRVGERWRNAADLRRLAGTIGLIAEQEAIGEEELAAARSAMDSYAQVFDWLGLIEINVYAILLLMTLVAGFNMVSGLLILLFRNISTIGTLKSLGMSDRSLSGVFLRVGARIVGVGMLSGNLLALLFCAVQGATHLVRLDPANYYLSFVPVHIELGRILVADAVAFTGIMLLLLIPTLFISKIDPASTMKTE